MSQIKAKMPQNHFTIIIRYIYCSFRNILRGFYLFLKMFSPTFILFYSMQIVFRISTFFLFLYEKLPSELYICINIIKCDFNCFFLQVLLVIVFEQRIIRLFVSHAQFYKSPNHSFGNWFLPLISFLLLFFYEETYVRLIMATFYNLCLKDFFFFSFS